VELFFFDKFSIFYKMAKLCNSAISRAFGVALRCIMRTYWVHELAEHGANK
jgi:hypothetical protein